MCTSEHRLQPKSTENKHVTHKCERDQPNFHKSFATTFPLTSLFEDSFYMCDKVKEK